jgi:hypothetical protein
MEGSVCTSAGAGRKAATAPASLGSKRWWRYLVSDALKQLLRFTGAVKRDAAIEVWLDAQAAAFRSIARSWFVRMRKCGSDVRELLHDGCPVACVGDAPFGYVNVFRAHANIGFFYGAELPDPMGLLEGNGKRMRHVKVKPNVEFDSAALGALIDAAYADIKARLDLERFIVGARK